MALETRRDTFEGIETGIRTSEIYPSSRLLSSITGVQVQPNKAIVGDNAFAHEAGIHQDGVLKAAITYEIMTPESIGRASNELVLGKHSGRHAFRDRLAELGFAIEGEEFERAFKRFKDLADAKKVIFNEDLEAIVADSVTAVGDRFGFVSLMLSCGSDAPPRAAVRLDVDGVAAEREATGVGPVDAIFRAIAELTETDSELIRYQVHAVTAGLDAQGEVSVTIEEGGRRVIGNGVHEDVMVASAKAYVHALNKLEWAQASTRRARASRNLRRRTAMDRPGPRGAGRIGSSCPSCRAGLEDGVRRERASARDSGRRRHQGAQAETRRKREEQWQSESYCCPETGSGPR